MKFNFKKLIATWKRKRLVKEKMKAYCTNRKCKMYVKGTGHAKKLTDCMYNV